MKIEIEEFLDHVDEWKFKVHEELKGLSPAQRGLQGERIKTHNPLPTKELCH